MLPQARYVVFHCLDEMVRTPDRSGFYYESLDLFDALHPQTILAYGMNGRALPVAHGAPLRLRVERQIGYKHAKYVARIEVVDRLDRHRPGQRRLLGRPRLPMVCGPVRRRRGLFECGSTRSGLNSLRSQFA